MRDTNLLERPSAELLVASLFCLAAAPSPQPSRSNAMASIPASWPIVELRRYTLHPGRRDELIDLFEREFIEPQEALGMQVLLHAREPAAPDRFVWLRGFRDLASRAPALQAFYGGVVWQAHRDAANATMIDSDDVHLLREATPGSGFTASPHRPTADATPTDAVFVVSIHAFAAPVDDAFLAFFADEVAPAARACGARIFATYVTEAGPNDFPRLPVREGEHVFVWIAAYADERAHAQARAAFERSPRWRELTVELSRRTIAPTERHRLAPAARSLMPALSAGDGR